MTENPGKAHSVKIPAEMAATFNKIASLLRQDRTWVISRALQQYLAGEGAEILHEAEGLAALDRGTSVDFDTVMGEADEIIAAVKARRAARKAA
jgi:predicted transcriptional regulator